MKKLLFALALSALTAGVANAQGACYHDNSKACRDAREAFAEHHGGVYPEQYYNMWYQGGQGRWNQNNNDWRWEGMDGRDYWRDHDRWDWHRNEHRNHGWW